ncbi:TonB-dependent receptor [Gluconacetobacter sacchari DSM 12717]|nr:TonB-dependent receptor [Gluconacetobacter sacchari DSM 12717]
MNRLLSKNNLLLCTFLFGDLAVLVPSIHAEERKPVPYYDARKPQRIAKQANMAGNIAKPPAGESITVEDSQNKRGRGGGMMRVETEPYAIQTVTRDYIETRNPTSTALDLIKNLPSVSVSTPDTSGMQGGRIQSRSLTDDDMALLVDGASATTAAYLAENIDSENLDSVSMMPGSSAIDLPTTTAAAGVLNETTHTPSHKFAVLTDFSYGTNNLSREFLRLESGDIGNSGVRGYLSFSNTHARSWMGAGINQRHHLDFGVRKDWTNGSLAKLFMSWNNEDFVVDNYPTVGQFLQYKHTGNGYGRMPGIDSAGNDSWKNNVNHWNNIFINAPIHIALTRKIAFDLHPYYNYGLGWSSWSDGFAGLDNGYTYRSGAPVAAGTPLSGQYIGNGDRRVGATAKIGYDIDRHNHFEFGYWYENHDYTEHVAESATLSNGASPNPANQEYQIYSNGSRIYSGDRTGYEIQSLFVQHTAKYFENRLLVNAGFKYIMDNQWYVTYPGRSRLGQNLTAPLPHLSISYQINSHHQLYINAEGDFRQPSPSAVANSALTGQLPKNQYSIKEELGYRYHDDYIVADLDLFNYNITNRLLSTYIGYNQTGVVNAGNQTARGFDIMLATQPIHGFSPYVSFEYLNARMDTDIAAEDSLGNLTAFHTKGRQAPLSPHAMANFGLTYSYKGFFANGTVHYTGPQSVTIAGDQRIPGYVTDTLSLGYHFKPFWRAQAPTIRLNFTNLTGSIVRTGVVGVGTNLNAVRLVNGNYSATGSGAQFYVEPRFSMTGTISTSF